MAAVPWAPDLPQCFQRAGYQIAPVDNVLRESMDVGPPKMRRRSSIQVVRVAAAMYMTSEQHRSFRAFYYDVLSEGTVAFALDDPDGVSHEFNIIEPPTAQPSGVGWMVNFSLQYIG